MAVTSPNHDMGTIPGPYGLPLVGNLPQLLPDPLPYIQKLHVRLGNVFYLGFAGNHRSVLLLGPEATKTALVDEADAFSARLGYQGQSVFIGEQAVLFRDGKDHRTLRRSMNGAFRPRALDGYLSHMSSHIDDRVRRWQTGAQDIANDVRLMSLGIASSVIAGAHLDEDAETVNGHFVNMLDAMVSVLPRLPGTAAARGVASRAALDGYFRGRIADRRRSSSSDLFTSICQASDEPALGDDEIVDNMLGLLVAGYETTASAITMMLYRLASHPDWQQRLRDEIDTHVDPDSVEPKALDALVETEWVLKETLRLDPPLPYFPRRTLRAVEIEGHVIPPNTAVTLAPAFNHRLEEIYPNSACFDPLRFSPERAEDKSHPCAWIPFGKGPHTCMGMHFAILEAKAFIARLLPSMDVVLTSSAEPKMKRVPVNRPAGDIPVRLVERTRA